MITVTAKIHQVCVEPYDHVDRKGRRSQIQRIHRTAHFKVDDQFVYDPREPDKYASRGHWRVSEAVYYKRDGTVGLMKAAIYSTEPPAELAARLDAELGQEIDALRARLW